MISYLSTLLLCILRPRSFKWSTRLSIVNAFFLLFQEGISFYNFNSNLKNPLILFSKILIISKYFLVKIFYIPLFISIFFLIFFTKSIDRKEIIFCLLIFIIYSVPYLFSSDATNNDRLVWHLKTSYDRMLLQCSAFFLPFALKTLKNFFK